jgi:hypothetical protein
MMKDLGVGNPWSVSHQERALQYIRNGRRSEPRSRERTMLGTDDVDEELLRGFGLSINELEPLLKVGGDAAEMKFMECCRYLWQADGAELTDPFIEAVFNKLPEKSRCVLFQRMLTIVYVAQDAERLSSPPA